MWYHVAEANSYLAITGAGIETVRIRKKAMVYPAQKCSKFTITPFDFSMALTAMTIEKLKFSLPAVFTIGPDDNIESLTKYAVLLTGGGDGSHATPTAANGVIAVGQSRGHVQDIVKGIIEGETRSIVSTMTMEELFKERRVFRDKVIKNVQTELDQFGLKIYNANVKELQDTPGSEYFAYLSRKAHEGALNQAKVDVADARMRGEVGEAEKQGRAKQEIAKIHAATAVLETERKAEKAQADAALADKEIQIEKDLNLSRISAKRVAEARDAELLKTVEEHRARMELEKQRATTVTKAVISREAEQERARAELFSKEQQAAGTKAVQVAQADANYYRMTKEADGNKSVQVVETDANYYRLTKEAEAEKIAAQLRADANYYARKQEAAGLIEMARGYGALADVLGGPQGLLQYMMLRDGTYEKLAVANGNAIKGLAPKINVWNTGSSGGDGAGAADPTAPIRNLFQSLPPLLSTIHDQTGISPPSWFAQMPHQQQQQSNMNGDVKHLEHGAGSQKTLSAKH